MTTPLVAYSKFVDSLATSGLVSEPELLEVFAVSNDDPQTASRELVSRGLLTEFQVSAFREDRASELKIGNYDLIDRLGAGGMGTVYKARHRRMKRIVALKVLSSSLCKNPVFVKRFQREVETIACLGHPNVVMAYDADVAEVGHFLVMEYVAGRDLAACVQQDGPFSVALAVSCIEQAARGLAYAHEQGIIHRDIKPHNLLLDLRGIVKVTDLGLARLTDNPEQSGSPAADVSSAGGVFGTLHYMPPEQAVDFASTDQRGDIYSLGCTLHFLLTGRPPFSGPTPLAILLAHRDAAIPRLSELRSGVPSQLDQLFTRMLAKEPADRVQTMHEVVDVLSRISAEVVELEEECEFELNESALGHGALTSSTFSMQMNPGKTLVDIPPDEQLSVLLVEPSRVQQKILTKYLDSLQFHLAGIASSGQEALNLIRTSSPQAVVCSLHLTDMTGLHLAERIRNELGGRSPGFVLITSAANEVQSDALVQMRRVQPLTKPFSEEQLKSAVDCVTVASVDSLAFSLTRQITPAGQRTMREHARVLIVDDSSSARMHLRTGLETMGFRHFTEVADGAEAIAMAAPSFCELIVTDYNMPLMDGRAMVSYFKQNLATASIPIIMVTTEADSNLLESVRRLGVVAIIDKTFAPEVVEPVIKSLFQDIG